MEELMNILTETCPGIDFEGQERLIDDGILDSLNIVMLVGELNEAFDISIGAEDLVPENFNSAQAIYALVQRLADE
ncbi:MAG: acyl carrier protein [Oscillospiraceae bacterium]|jgi:acyl carrier protein|nr:acyl carrier protein [Oscillospiraceae bacterium]